MTRTQAFLANRNAARVAAATPVAPEVLYHDGDIVEYHGSITTHHGVYRVWLDDPDVSAYDLLDDASGRVVLTGARGASLTLISRCACRLCNA